MAGRNLIRILSAAASAATLVSYARYRKEMRIIRDTVESGSTIAETSVGPIEYAEAGEGEPMLMIHGAGGGYDQGLLVGRDFVSGYRLIAPSRFGYLKTPVPDDYSPAAQADAHAALLELLGIERSIVVGASAGAPSAVELTLRHPQRVSALILLVPRAYHPTQTAHADESAPSQTILRVIEASANFLFWLAMRVSRRSVVRFLGVPPEVEARASEDDRRRVTDVMNSILPLSMRVRGLEVDGLTDISPWPLERITAPTLIISAEDDLYKTLPAARYTAERIAGAELRVLKGGGHLMVSQSEQVQAWIDEFLRRRLAQTGPRPLSKLATKDARQTVPA